RSRPLLARGAAALGLRGSGGAADRPRRRLRAHAGRRPALPARAAAGADRRRPARLHLGRARDGPGRLMSARPPGGLRTLLRVLGFPLRRVLNPRVAWTVAEVDARLGSRDNTR